MPGKRGIDLKVCTCRVHGSKARSVRFLSVFVLDLEHARTHLAFVEFLRKERKSLLCKPSTSEKVKRVEYSLRIMLSRVHTLSVPVLDQVDGLPPKDVRKAFGSF